MELGIIDPLTGHFIVAAPVLLGGFSNNGIVIDVLKEPLVPVTLKLYVVCTSTGGTVTVSCVEAGVDNVDCPKTTLLPEGSGGELDSDKPT
jgi:hypothetical protein